MQENEHRAEAQRLALLPRDEQRAIIAMHRADAANPKVPKRDREFAKERADTLDLLKRDSASLERALQDAGLKTSDNALQFSLRQHTSSQDDTSGQTGPRVILSDDDPAPLEAMRQGYGRLLGLSGGLDIRV